jgi:hypothetical protein
MFETAPKYIPDEELTPDQAATRQVAKAEAETAAQNNASLVFNPTTGAMEPAEVVHSELERMQGEQV